MVTVDQATTADAEEIAAIIGEVEVYYGGTNTPGNVGRIRALLFGERPVASVLLARDGDAVLGMASYSFLWPAAGVEASLYLKELFVRETARRQGVARALMAKLQEIATETGCSRVEWTADSDNPPALAFYKALRAEPNDKKIFYRIENQD